MAALPVGAPAPPDGALPDAALRELRRAPFGVYVHVPFCATRCGYCDFNTYTPGELATSPSSWLDGVRRELDLAAQVLGEPVPADTVFVGGGTPSLLGAAGLAAVLDAVRSSLGLDPGAEVTTEANPESTSPEFFAGIAAAGYTRVSLGMQSAAPHVLAVLDRVHTPGRPVAAAAQARAAGIGQVSLDLIYGTPGETREDLAASLDAVLSAGVDHVSAYALVVEPGTALARRVARGELPAPDDDVLAERYEQIDTALSVAGLHWYEVSNWAKAAGVPLPAQRRLLGRGKLVGRRPWCAFPRRRGAMVERQTPSPLRRRAAGPLFPLGRPGDPQPRGAAHRAGDAGTADGRGIASGGPRLAWQGRRRSRDLRWSTHRRTRRPAGTHPPRPPTRRRCRPQPPSILTAARNQEGLTPMPGFFEDHSRRSPPFAVLSARAQEIGGVGGFRRQRPGRTRLGSQGLPGSGLCSRT